MKPNPTNEDIITELTILGQKDKRPLPQISSVASTRQYLPLYKLIQNYLPKGKKVLDWGTGIGHFSYFLVRNGYQATGFTLEDFNFKNWLKNQPYKFVQGKGNEPTKLPFKAKSFDAIVSVGVLEHVHEYGGDELKSLKEFHRLLKSNGYFICYHLPNRYSLIEYLGKLLTNNFHHKYRFTQKDIKILTRKSKFKLLEVNRYGFLPRNSLGKLPPSFAKSKLFAWTWDTLDNFLSFIFSPICQNYYFVAKKLES